MEALEDTTGEGPYSRLVARGPLLPGDIKPVDVVLPGGSVITATHGATAEWATTMGGRVLGEVVPPNSLIEGQA